MSLSLTGILMGPQEENKIFNKIKCDKWTLWVKQAVLVRFADATEGGRRKKVLRAGKKPRWNCDGIWKKNFFNFKLEGFDHIIHNLMYTFHLPSFAIPLSLLICCSQSRVPYYVNKGMRQMVPQSHEFIWGEGFNYGWVGPAVFWVQQTSQTLWDWQNPRCSFPGTF